MPSSEGSPIFADQEVAWEFHRRTGRSVSRSSMNRVLLELALTRRTLAAVEQSKPRIQALRRRFIELAKNLDPRRLVFIDEAASHIAMTRDYARAPRGERAHGSVFETFLERVLLRKLKPGDIVVLDNVGAHKTSDVRRLIEAAEARVLYLPPYSPDLNPIELCWSKLKASSRSSAPGRTPLSTTRSAGRWISSTAPTQLPGSTTAATSVTSSDRRL